MDRIMKLALPDIEPLPRIFHTPMEMPTVRRVGARGLQARASARVGRVPPRGFSGCEISGLITTVRGQKVILDADLAPLYGVETRALVQAIKRNAGKFPEDFLFRLTSEEAAALRSQIVILKTGRGKHRKYPPYAFTEHGTLMAATVLNSPRAVAMSVYIKENALPYRVRRSLPARRNRRSQ
jgi:hypothetical protein